MKTPTNLSRYWLAKRWAISKFLIEATNGAAASKTTVKTWFDAITTPVNACPEDQFETKLAALKTARTAANNGTGNARRSAQMVRMVQGLIGARENGRGFHTEAGDTYTGTEVTDYKTAVREAATAAYNFLEALKPSDMDVVVVALQDLLDNNPGITPEIWQSINRLRLSMEASLAAQPGSGEGSGPWPIITISSSSSSSSGSP